MDVNITIAVLVALSCVVTIGRIVSGPLARASLSWLVVAVMLLTILGVAWILAPQEAGYIGGSFWLVFYLIPALGYRQMNRLFAQQNYHGAHRVASVLRWLHPVSTWTAYLEVIQAMDLARQGEFEKANVLFERNQAAPGWIGQMARVAPYAAAGDWQQVLMNLQNAVLRRDPIALSNYIRALGETGDLNGMIAELERYRTVLQQTRSFTQAAIFVFALCGLPEGLERLFQGPLKQLPDSIKKFWRGTAYLAAGDRAAAEPMLNEPIANAPDARTRNAAASRLSKGVTLAPDVLTSESRQILAGIGQALEQEQRFDTRVGNGRGIPYVTYGLIIINVVAFLLEELNGGSTNNETIYRLGALWAPDVAAGQWDRLILPLFLHFGLLHLLFNMVALYVLGPYVEFALGLRRYLVMYFVSGIGASLLVYGLVQAGLAPNDLFLGASGAIMGVLGAMAAIMYRGWQRDKAPIARNRLISIVLIIALQVVLDASFILQSSLPAHLGGAVIGFIIASLMPHHASQLASRRIQSKPLNRQEAPYGNDN